jgi:4-hydroxyphenylpyruvate dioxygenase
MSAHDDHLILASDGSAQQFKNIDHLELYVGNAHQAAHFYRTACGFTPTACAGLETGSTDRTSVVLEQGDIRLVLTNTLHPEGPIAEHVRLHGDSIRDIAFTVTDAERAFHDALRLGARPVLEPTVFEDDAGQAVKATIGVYGDTTHSFIQRDAYTGTFFPGYKKIDRPLPANSAGLTGVDHIAISVEEGELAQWIEFYERVLKFHLSHQEDIETDLSAMNSSVVQNSTGSIKFPMMEPAPGKRKSQIDEYLSFHHGPGAQHVALLSDDIVSTVRVLHKGSIEFLNTPPSYYQLLEERVGSIDENIAELRDLSILVDRDRWGYLMQVFSKPIQGRPTGFLEIIQRKGARGFGSGNVKALFQAIEREQELRGNL